MYCLGHIGSVIVERMRENMKNKTRKLLVVIMVVTIVAGALASCATKPEQAPAEAENAVAKILNITDSTTDFVAIHAGSSREGQKITSVAIARVNAVSAGIAEMADRMAENTQNNVASERNVESKKPAKNDVVRETAPKQPIETPKPDIAPVETPAPKESVVDDPIKELNLPSEAKILDEEELTQPNGDVK